MCGVIVQKKELRGLRDAFRILGGACRCSSGCIRKKLEPVCSEYSLTRMEMNILLFLANNPAYDTATDIVEVRHLTKSHVSASVKTLQARGYLQRVYLSGNKRKTAHLRLVPAAEPVVEKRAPCTAGFFYCAAKGLAPAERAALKSAFGKLLKNAREALEEGNDAV